MKRLLALLFLSLYLSSTNEFHELMKSPLLAEHFTEHKNEKPSLTFWKFLCIHYTHNDVQDEDHDKDMKLPFKSIENFFSTSYIILSPEQKLSLEKSFFLVETKITPNYYKEVIITHSLNSIWQPPKIS